MNKLYNITNLFCLYYVDIDEEYKKHKIKTLSKEWWKFVWELRPKFRIKIETYYN